MDDDTNSQLHAHNGHRFPFSGDFKGVTFNTQSLYAYEALDTIDAVARIAQPVDFAILSETRETAERKATLDHRLLSDHLYFSSFLDAHKGGIGILVKKTFLKQFPFTDVDNCWKVLVQGRVGRLCLSGPRGCFHIYAIYFDPSDKKSQKQCTTVLSEQLDSRAHSLIAGDFNFVECEQDRYIKQTGAWSIGDDKQIAKEWQRLCTKHDLKEWVQPHLTCETGIVLSRIDRVYSNLHLIHTIVSNPFATVLERDPSVSAHRPLAFGIRSGRRKKANMFPSWVTECNVFGTEVEAEYRHLCGQHERSLTGFHRLDILKNALQNAAKFVKHKNAKETAQTTEHRISATISFLRALAIGDLQTARKMQEVYTRLNHVNLIGTYLASPELRAIQDHALELVQSSTQERIAELRSSRSSLPDQIYKQRKDGILGALKRLIPGSGAKIESIRDASSGGVVSEPMRIAQVLTEYWQQVFDDKPTNAKLREQWLKRFRGRNNFNFTVAELTPTDEDVDTVFKNLPTSAPGPDGIPFAAWKNVKDILAPILLDAVKEMIAGTSQPDDLFNRAFLICLPKTDSEVHEPGGTRPLSIVDAINRIIASIFRVALERVVAKYVSEAQRGFIPGRQMLRNILEIDFQAQKISIKYKKGAIILFDFKAAFPSMNHGFMWETLAAWGLPAEYINALRLFYVHNHHTMRTGDIEVDSVDVHSGVRQGCPLSPIIFAMCADVLLTELADILRTDEIVRAFADDAGVVGYL
jgi:endonuclease/exonuclease/phosphatase family metal-dependent hydrolase